MVLTWLAVPGAASAAGLGELRPLELPAGRTCVDPTGVPGELALQTVEGVSLVSVSRSGFTPGQRLSFAAPYPCRSLVGRASGAAVIAVDNGYEGVLAAVRDPGGAWGPVVSLPTQDGWHVDDIEPAVSDRGDVLLVWRETYSGPGPWAERLVTARRAPGGSFGAAQVIASASGAGSLLWFQPGVAATGEALVGFMAAGSDREPYTAGVQVAIAPAQGAFAAPVHVADARWLSVPSLDVAADGQALLAVNDGASMRVAERAPGAPFGAATPISSSAPGIFLSPTVRLGAGGAATVAWTAPGTAGGLVVASRRAGGAFSPPVAVTTGRAAAYAPWDPFFASETYYRALVEDPDAELDRFEADARSQPTADGRVLYALTERAAGGTGVAISLATLSGGVPTIAPAARVSSGGDATPFVLADGTPAVVWSEPVASSEEQERLRVAAEGVTTPRDPRPPTLRVGEPLERTLGELDPLRLPIRCSAACDVTATVESALTSAQASVRLKHAGRATLSLKYAAYAAAEGRVRVRIEYGAPGALHPATRTIRLRLTARPDARSPRIAVQARRHGNRVRVRVRLSGVADTLYVSGENARAYDGEPLVTRTLKVDRSATLTLPAQPRLRWVAVRLPYDAGPDGVVVTRVR